MMISGWLQWIRWHPMTIKYLRHSGNCSLVFFYMHIVHTADRIATFTSDTWTCSERSSFLLSDSCWCKNRGHVSAFCFYVATTFFWHLLPPLQPYDAIQTTADRVLWSVRHSTSRNRRRRRRRRPTAGAQWCSEVFAVAAAAKNPHYSPIPDTTNLNQTTDWWAQYLDSVQEMLKYLSAGTSCLECHQLFIRHKIIIMVPRVGCFQRPGYFLMM